MRHQFVLRAAPCLLAAMLLTACGRDDDGVGPGETFTHPDGDAVTSVALGGRPHGVAVAKSGVFYISQIDAGSVTRGRVEAASETFDGSAAVGATPAHVAVDRDGTTAYTANQSGNSVSVVAVATNTTVATIPLTDGGFNLLVSPAGDRVYVTTASGTLHVIDAAKRRVLTTIPVGAAANGLAYDAKQNVLYVSARDAARVTAIDAATNTVTRVYPVSAQPQRIALSADGDELYVANESSGLEVLNVGSGARAAVPGVPAGAVGLALSPDNAQLYVTNPPAGRVDVVDRAARTVLRTITVARRPRNVAFDYTGRTAIITDEAGEVVFVR